MSKNNLYLQNIVKEISLDEDLPNWQFDWKKFSKGKTLFDFQQQALENALKALWLYFKDKEEEKVALFNQYKINGLEEKFDYDLKKKSDRKTAKYLLEYDKDYPVKENKISFAHFINQMSFWMATGSGKTLIIVKLIEFLGKLIAENELPVKDILYLAHREDLLDQLKNHIEEFNNSNFETKINLKNLKNYERVKHGNVPLFAKNEITVFYYRSDLISDIQTKQIINFRNYDNNGKWYILLDEAHKGEKEKDDSKRQILYSILSRNGFLFNFSATFTDPRDFATCAYNFNLSSFVKEGYGKHIYVSSKDINGFHKQNDFSEIEKQKIVLKTLLLLTYINKYFEKIRKVNKSLYHRPLLLTLVNSVNRKNSDLELFFKELEKVAKNKIRAKLLEEAKQELIQEFSNDKESEFEKLEFNLNIDLIKKIKYEDILNYIFNAKTPGNFEVLRIPGNKKELIFKLATTEKPFALIRIGDIASWLKDKLDGYEINESFENESYFKQIKDDDSDINILMGSRSFYEGWDSNRPNIVLFVNIGIGKDAKKFVLQSIGRGVRIEPLKNKRKRIKNLYNDPNETEIKEYFDKIKDTVDDIVLPVESLFVFGTKAKNVEQIIATMNEAKQEGGESLGDLFILNPETQKHLLLVPVYKTSEKIIAEEECPSKHHISCKDFELTSNFYDLLGDKIALVKYGCEVKVLKKIKESFKEKEKYYDFSQSNSLLKPELNLERIFDYLNVKSKEFNKFKELEDEIVHFKKIRFSGGDKYIKEIKEKIEEIRNYPKREEELKKLKNNYRQMLPDDYYKQRKLLEDTKSFDFEMNDQKIKIKYLANHYYLPIIVPKKEKIDYINHIINVDSEVRFIKKLENHLSESDNTFEQFDWWMFSKLDHTLDDISIPYYSPNGNKMANFKPDFIFWMQKGKQYTILFVDPKGTEYTDGYRKINGYKKIFETNNRKDFSYKELTINVKLLFYTTDIAKVIDDGYERYWFDNFTDFAEKISS